MSNKYFLKNGDKYKTPSEILQESHERIYQNYMNQREKEKLRAWIEEEIKKQAIKELENALSEILK